MELSSFSIKKFLIFSYISGNVYHKIVLFILGNRKPKRRLLFQKRELLTPSVKNTALPPANLPPLPRSPPNSYISGNGTSLPQNSLMKLS